MVLLGATRTGFSFVIFGVLTSLCLLLMTAYWRPAFWLICGQLMKVIVSIEFLQLGDKGTLAMIDLVVDDVKSQRNK